MIEKYKHDFFNEDIFVQKSIILAHCALLSVKRQTEYSILLFREKILKMTCISENWYFLSRILVEIYKEQRV